MTDTARDGWTEPVIHHGRSGWVDQAADGDALWAGEGLDLITRIERAPDDDVRAPRGHGDGDGQDG